jgi:CheY-like chemotaxis protein
MPTRLLLADDNRDAVDSLAILLGSEGFETTVAYDGAEAMREFVQVVPAAVVLDIGMPGLSGYDVASLVRANEMYRGVLLIAMTGWGQETDVARAKAVGFDAHLTKPIEFEHLLQILRDRGVFP